MAETAADVDALREQVAQLLKEQEHWFEERSRLSDEVETLRSRVQKLAVAAGQDTLRADAETQTEDVGDVTASSKEEVSGLDAMIAEMLRKPEDAAVQLQGIEALFAQQTQAGGEAQGKAAPALHRSLQVAVAVFSNHQANLALLLKASQFMSVLLAEPAVQQELPVAMLHQAAQAVLAASAQLLEKSGGVIPATPAQAGLPSPTKLLTWFLSLLALLMPCLDSWLKDQACSKAFVQSLLCDLISRLLAASELPQEALILKSIQLLPLLPMEAWIQRVCLDSGAVHSLVLARQRLAAKKGLQGGEEQGTPLTKAIQAAIRGVFAGNLELCSRALDDTFVNDAFVCLEVLEELQGLEQQRRGTFRKLDEEYGIIGKAQALWSFHQRQALEDPEPEKCSSRAVLQKVAGLLQGTFLKLPPQRLLQRMEEFQSSEPLIRMALAALHSNAQIRLQIAVNYVDNNVIPVMIESLQMLLRGFSEEGVADACSPRSKTEAAFRLLEETKLPAEAWPYINYCLEVCLHVLSHWSCAKISSQHEGDTLDPDAAPIRLAHAGVVDALAELIDASAAGLQLRVQPPAEVVQKAQETLQALFERNGHICLFCMNHYPEVKQIISVGCESIAADPLIGHPDMQQQAVELLAEAFEKFSVKDDRLGRKLLKALTNLFESSYNLVVWFLQHQPISKLPELHSLDVHVEAVKAIARAGYWSAEDAPLLPDFVALLAGMLLDAVEGHLDASSPPSGTGRRVFDLTEAEELAASCTASMLHLMLIDPSPPTVLRCLARSLCRHATDKGSLTAENPDDLPPLEDVDGTVLHEQSSEESVNAVMKIMQVFPSSDRIQMNSQHILTSLLGE